jgi:hypothetical protein
VGDVLGRPRLKGPAFQPYWGKPAVRNDRGDRGDVGIIRSPLRASVLPDRSTSAPSRRSAGFSPLRNMHAHFQTLDNKVSGHVQGLKLAQGLTLSLPKG